MNELSFSKFHGAGNDFIIIDNRQPYHLTNEQLRYLCSRHLGIGADGLILIEPPKDKNNHFLIRYFNSDGNEASLCGNGSRCAVAFAELLNIVTTEQCAFEAVDGVHAATIVCHEQGRFWQIAVKMNDVAVIEKYKKGFFVNTGSPHFVLRVKDVKNYNVLKNAKKWRFSPQFTNGTNVNFYESNQQGVFVRTFERGVEAETLSCGTGVTATALVWALTNNLTDGKHRIKIFATGGTFHVEFSKKDNAFYDIQLIGPVKLVYEGKMII